MTSDATIAQLKTGSGDLNEIVKQNPPDDFKPLVLLNVRKFALV